MYKVLYLQDYHPTSLQINSAAPDITDAEWFSPELLGVNCCQSGIFLFQKS